MDNIFNIFLCFFRWQREKEISMQLASKLKELEGQVVKGGRNILDTYSERQTELEKRLDEIAERKVCQMFLFRSLFGH